MDQFPSRKRGFPEADYFEMREQVGDRESGLVCVVMRMVKVCNGVERCLHHVSWLDLR